MKNAEHFQKIFPNLNYETIRLEYFELGYSKVSGILTDHDASSLHRDLFINITESNRDFNDVVCFPASLRQVLDPRIWRSQGFINNTFKSTLRMMGLQRSARLKGMKKELSLPNCRRIDAYFTKSSPDDIIHWHCDQSFGGAPYPSDYFNGRSANISINPVGKLIIYLTDVDFKNGALSYIPGSQKISVAIRKLISRGFVKYSPFHDLKDALLFVNQHEEALVQFNLVDSRSLALFKENAVRALGGVAEFSLPLRRGDGVIFNDLGYHMASAAKLDDRLVIRLFFF
jgi:hypothetical protein